MVIGVLSLNADSQFVPQWSWWACRVVSWVESWSCTNSIDYSVVLHKATDDFPVNRHDKDLSVYWVYETCTKF